MSQVSTEFHKLFTTQHGSLRKWIELPNEDPVAFGMICESAHGSFIPHDDISLQTLANMTDDFQRYRIPAISSVHHTAEFSFAVHAFRLSTLSTIELLQLLGVAKALGSVRYNKLLEDVFLQYPLQFEALPIEQITGSCETDLAILANVKLRGAACRARVASTMLSSPDGDCILHLQEKCGLAVWILEDSLSLQEINTRLRSIRNAADSLREQLLNASGAIIEETADINDYFRTTIGQAQRVEEGHGKDVLDVHHEVKRLEIQIAESGRISGDSFVIDNSSSDTDFEDIEAYAGSLGDCYDGLQFDDSESVVSAKTV
ncbi:hypothetical protein HBI26_238450 [Parastagonospora nodorum]|nr:hypothetical protein HBH51_239030 [Parastagonospora nodorum]KAH4215594.1 hypothetical protein HBI06_245810 [Parastagonospora nodorum]KAH4224336.1 hypothetical protein HBI05_238860 [Parastagonospora nodorum]KAH4354519.1 hypothetical protein HBH97_247350 [Parastagonospora nodorum]KAH4374730.1 hypothetical protein HBH99_220410 [Parastagonospora nodorum]